MIQKNIEPLKAKLDQLEEKVLRESLKVRKRGKKLFSSVVVLYLRRANFISDFMSGTSTRKTFRIHQERVIEDDLACKGFLTNLLFCFLLLNEVTSKWTHFIFQRNIRASFS